MTQTAKEYAVALFMLAVEDEKEKQVSDELKIVTQIFRRFPEYLDLLASPNISMRERTAAIDKAFKDSVCDYVVNFLKLLCEKNNIRLVHRCISEYEELYHANDGITSANVITAVALTKSEKAKLKEKLEKFCGKKVIMHYIVNSAVLGGVIVHVDGKVLDGSLRRRLRDIKEVIDK